MSTNTKHILISVLFAAIAQVLQGLIQIIPASLQPVITAGVAYFTHYVLENPSTSTNGAPSTNGGPSTPPAPSLPAPTPAAASTSGNPAS